MIVGISGEVIQKELTFVHINTNGLVYKVSISVNCYNNITKKNITLFTTYIVKEDSQSLYGFYDINEKNMFDVVIKINGVGPKVALAICSTFTPFEFSQIIDNKDVSSLKKVPGIGPKSASRILVELNGVVLDGQDSEMANSDKQQAFKALETLGFKKDMINKILAKCTSTNTADLVKEALKLIQN